MKYIKYSGLKILFLVLVLTGFRAHGANEDNFNGIQKWVDAHKANGATFSDVTLLTPSPNANVVLPNNIAQYSLFQMDHAVAESLMQYQPLTISVTIPVNGTMIKMDLVRANVITDNFVVTNSDGQPVLSSDAAITGIHYQGYIEGEESSSVVALSIFKDQINGIISSKNNGNILVGKLKENANSLDKDIHIVYEINALPEEAKIELYSGFGCKTSAEDFIDVLPEGGQASKKCINIFVEVDYDIYSALGFSYSAAAEFALSLANESACIYKNDGINIKVCEVRVWDHASPYTHSSSASQLAAFESTRTSFTGTLAIMIDLKYLNGGLAHGKHGLDGTCETPSERQCYAGIYSYYADVPTYSASVEVFTHELGHLMGSYHTHDCVWNGTSTAIDGCFTTAGGCPSPPIPSIGGTIMSYCHLTSAGINFYLGFGPQPGNLIRNKILAATCLSECTNCPEFWYLYRRPSFNKYEAYNFIQSTQDVTLVPGGVEYNAGNYVLLLPDFVAAGNEFLAHIEGCVPNSVIYSSARSIASEPDKSQSELKGNNIIDIFPNPAESSITVSYPCSQSGQLEISVKEVSGRVVHTENVKCNGGSTMQHTVDISSFVPGIYFVELTLNDQHIIKKIVKL